MADNIDSGEENSPKHIAIIPDGNRRWAKEKGLLATQGHIKSGDYKNLKSLFSEAKRLGVKYFSLWGFSTENWARDKKERTAIFELISNNLKNLMRDAPKEEIRFRHIGRKDRLPSSLVLEIKELESATDKFDKFNVQLFLDYGGRDEIMRAVNSVLKSGNKEIDESGFSKLLDTKDIPDVDLIIRTSGEHRMSGFMPFQSVYAEFYFTDIYFPDFDSEELRKAINDFKERKRRFGQ